MRLTNIIRRCDLFGAAFGFKFEGESKYKTVAGGIASLCLKLLVGGYFILQSSAVTGYKDPTISSYTVLEDRNKMIEAKSFADYNMEFYFNFVDI